MRNVASLHMPTKLLLVGTSLVCVSSGLQCHECSEEFTDKWKPRACQLNASLVPVRDCLLEQTFCFVERVTVKGIVTSISRNCADDCQYGCAASGFGVTSFTCTTCCSTDMCNTMDGSVSPLPQTLPLLSLDILTNHYIVISKDILLNATLSYQRTLLLILTLPYQRTFLLIPTLSYQRTFLFAVLMMFRILAG
ncbi:DNA-directed RNA polymerase subunit [Plakobranchus ocellatus]|uniref:DNA-directed RNA polymerase subunit n=1 Tax=Plakobranchus ocellatus TaxID=259542 RepID=A0AAV3ZUE6_9GAST|nr:DNA-directed RNA polymerase subunit [Plakobranchus ocellatus]